MRARILTKYFLVCCIAAGACKSFAVEPLSYEPAIVQLSGMVVVEDQYGPPNFGETPEIDKKEKVPVLQLDTPIAVTADTKPSANMHSFSDVQRIQLVGSPALRLVDLVGQHVILRGTLFEKQSGENYTDVLMSVQEIVSTE